MLLYPTATLHTALSCVPAASNNSLSTFSVNKVISISAPFTASSNAGLDIGLSSSHAIGEIPESLKVFKPADGILPVTTTFKLILN